VRSVCESTRLVKIGQALDHAMAKELFGTEECAAVPGILPLDESDALSPTGRGDWRVLKKSLHRACPDREWTTRREYADAHRAKTDDRRGIAGGWSSAEFAGVSQTGLWRAWARKDFQAGVVIFPLRTIPYQITAFEAFSDCRMKFPERRGEEALEGTGLFLENAHGQPVASASAPSWWRIKRCIGVSGFSAKAG